MIKNGYPTSQIWKQECTSIDKDGIRHIIDSVSVLIHPQYVCQKVSTFGVDSRDLSSGFSRTTYPAPCLADVTGRDLDIVFPISFIFWILYGEKKQILNGIVFYNCFQS